MTKTTRLSFAIALLALAVPLAGTAQTADGRMRVTIPFRFLAGETMMPPDTYFVDLMESSHAINLMGWERAVRLPVKGAGVRRPETRNGKGALLFELVGNTYVLRSAWNPNRTEGCSLYRSQKVERELAGAPSGKVVIAWAR